MDASDGEDSARRAVGAGVGGVVLLAGVLRADLRVDLGRRDVRVAEELLHLAQAGAGAEHMRREAVAQSVRRHAPGKAGIAGVALEDEPEALAGQPLAAPVDEERRFLALADEARSRRLRVFADLLAGLLGEGELPLPVAF